MTRDEKRDRLREAGNWLRHQRERRGFTRPADFARALNVDRSLVSNWENGKNSVTDERADQIAEVLGMDIIEVRRGLGLWVPSDDQTDRQSGPGDQPAEEEDPDQMLKDADEFLARHDEILRRRSEILRRRRPG